MSKRQQFDEILDSYVNGQRVQMIEQLTAVEDMSQFIHYIDVELNRSAELIDILKIYFKALGQ